MRYLLTLHDEVLDETFRTFVESAEAAIAYTCSTRLLSWTPSKAEAGIGGIELVWEDEKGLSLQITAYFEGNEQGYQLTLEKQE